MLQLLRGFLRGGSWRFERFHTRVVNSEPVAGEDYGKLEPALHVFLEAADLVADADHAVGVDVVELSNSK